MKDWSKIKNYIPLCSFIPTTVLTICTAISLNDYTAPVPTIELSEQTPAITTENTDINQNKNKSSRTTVTTAAIPTIASISETSTYKDGTYTGTGTGFAGAITVQVIIKDGKIADISIVSTNDDSPYIDSASALLKTIIATQSTNVDTVSGATYSSVGLIQAVRDALQKAGGSNSSYSALPSLSSAQNNQSSEAPSIKIINEPDSYQDGVYVGSGSGFAGAITVQVAISGGKITDISIISTNDDSPYINSASSLLQNIIALQSTNVDTISGATFSSVGLIEAVRNALSCAGASAITTLPEEPSIPDSVKGKFPYPDGVYLGSGEGYRGETTVAVSLKDGTIDTILVLNTDDDEAFFKKAETLIKTVLEKQTTDVDVISSATFSSEGILEAIEQALENAKNSSTTKTTTATAASTSTTTKNTTITTIISTSESTESITTIPNKYIDGEYKGIAICYPDDNEDFDAYTISVTVRIENDTIVEIKDICGIDPNHDSGNDWYLNRASTGTSRLTGVVPQILTTQDINNIDAISGATCSSYAIVDAVADALNSALK